MGIFSGFEKLGLGNIEGEDLFEDPRKKEVTVKKEEAPKKLQLVNEEDYLFDKKYKNQTAWFCSSAAARLNASRIARSLT